MTLVPFIATLTTLGFFASLGREILDGVSFIRPSGPGLTTREAVSLLFEAPLQTNGGKLNISLDKIIVYNCLFVYVKQKKIR